MDDPGDASDPKRDALDVEMRVALLVVAEINRTLESAALRARIRASPILVTSAIEDASRVIGALVEQVRKIHATLAGPTRVALGIEEPPQTLPPPPIAPGSALS